MDMMVFEQLGNRVSINGINPCYLFKADLYSMGVSPGSISSISELKVGKSGFNVYKQDSGCSKLNMSFYVLGNTKEEALNNASSLLSECAQCLIKTEDDVNSEYVSVLTDSSVEFTGIEWVYSVSMIFDCVRRLPLMKVTSSSSKSVLFKNVGTISSGMKVTVTSKSAMSNVSVAGVVVKSLKANMPFVLDGLDGKVLENGINKILDTDLVKFPKVEPGENELKSNVNLDWIVEWYPTFHV